MEQHVSEHSLKHTTRTHTHHTHAHTTRMHTPHTPHTTQVLELLPAGTRLKEIEQFLTTVLQERTQKRKRTQMLRGLLLAEHLQVRGEGG